MTSSIARLWSRSAALALLCVTASACSSSAPDDAGAGGASVGGLTSSAGSSSGGRAPAMAGAGSGSGLAAGASGLGGGGSGAGFGSGASSGAVTIGGAAVGGAAVGGAAVGGAAVGGAAAAGGNSGGSSAGTAGSEPVAGSPGQGWVGTWATAQQLTEDANEPPSPGLTNNTLRQIVRVSIGGQRLRLRFSNEYGSSPVTLNKVHCATSSGGHGIASATDKALTFAGAPSVTLQAKDVVFSDAFDFELLPLSKVAVSIQFGATSSDITGHPSSRTTSYLQAGDAVASASLPSAVMVDHWYIFSGIDVMAGADSHAVVILGDSISDGRGSTTNGNDRWPDALAERLQANPSTVKIGVLNQSIGGNAVLTGGLGPPAITRFDADVLKQSGVRWLIVFEGVNDIGESTSDVSSGLTAGYQTMISKAHAAGLRVFGVTILPFKGHSYYTAANEATRTVVNEWVRKPAMFDRFIDMDAVVRDPAKPDTLLSTYDQGDHLHLNPSGYKKLAESVDLALFE